MGYIIKINDSIGVSEHIKAETEIDAIIYRQEFENHRTEYLRAKKESELVIAFIFLQIYIECFLHQNMRKIVELEFKPPRDNTCSTWLGGEKRYVQAKIDNFATLFFAPVPDDIQQLLIIVKDRFDKISDIRNLFAHGHKIAAWSDSDGNSGSTQAKSLLTETQLNQSVAEVNEMGLAWSTLLDRILTRCKGLRGVDEFKFPSI